MKATNSLLLTAAVCSGLIITTNANANLIPALMGQAVNDTDLNIIWLANANLAASNTFGVSGINSDGTMSWNTAQSWIAAMNSANYLGYNDWRLPIVTDTGALGCDYSFNGTDCGYHSTSSEMAHLYYSELGNESYISIDGTTIQAHYGLDNSYPFNGFKSGSYWSGTAYASYSAFSWYFDTVWGYQNADSKMANFYVTAVRPGQLPASAVPVPAAAWLFCSGLIVFFGMGKRSTNVIGDFL